MDSDCDGYTSAAALMNYLNMAFPYYTAHHVSYAMHKGKQHGINLDYVPKGTELVIIPDAGSNQKEELTEVRWFSMDELKNMVRTKELNEDQISCFIKVCNFLEDNK